MQPKGLQILVLNHSHYNKHISITTIIIITCTQQDTLTHSHTTHSYTNQISQQKEHTTQTS